MISHMLCVLRCMYLRYGVRRTMKHCRWTLFHLLWHVKWSQLRELQMASLHPLHFYWQLSSWVPSSVKSIRFVFEAEGLSQLLLCNFANTPNSFQFCTACLLFHFCKTADTLVEDESMKCLQTTRKKSCGADSIKLCGTLQQRSSRVKYFLERYGFPRTAIRCQAGLLLERSNHPRKYLTAGVVLLSVWTIKWTTLFILSPASVIFVRFQCRDVSLWDGYKKWLTSSLKWLMWCSSPRYAVKATSVKSLDGNGRCSYRHNMVLSLTL